MQRLPSCASPGFVAHHLNQTTRALLVSLRFDPPHHVDLSRSHTDEEVILEGPRAHWGFARAQDREGSRGRCSGRQTGCRRRAQHRRDRGGWYWSLFSRLVVLTHLDAQKAEKNRDALRMLAEKAATLAQLVKQVVSDRTVDGQLVPLLERLTLCVSPSHFYLN